MTDRPIIVRAYDLGGYGDIAGALRVTDYLASQGKNAHILPMSDDASDKIDILEPDQQRKLPTNSQPLQNAIIIDVAGHYKDSRISNTLPAPHLFMEDMDNPQDRTSLAPLYIKTGLQNHDISEAVKACGIHSNPLFYRPYKEQEIPASLDPAELIIKQILRRQIQKTGNTEPTDLTKLIFNTTHKIPNIGFAHCRPEYELLIDIASTPYIHAIEESAKHSSEQYAVGLFIQSDTQCLITNTIRERFNIISANFIYLKDTSHPTLYLLGPTPQLQTSQMFLSATIPTLVTGDLTLSDALYFLLAKDGPGFFYDCPDWKIPTMQELERILEDHDRKTKYIFRNFQYQEPSFFSDKTQIDNYRQNLKEALRKEITKRFGPIPEYTNGIPPRTPFLFQDTAGLVIDKLLTDDAFFEKVENKRQKITPTPQPKLCAENKTPSAPKNKPELIKYGDLEIERYLPKASNGYVTGMSYDKSLERIKNAGLDRHLRPQEAFGIIIDKLEEKITEDFIDDTDIFLTGAEEWLSLAFERKDNQLICYLDPTGLVLNENTHKYEKINFTYSQANCFYIYGIPSNTRLKLNNFNQHLIKFIFGKPYKDLPKIIQETANILLPPDEFMLPINRGGPLGYDLRGYIYGYWGVSRGVRHAKNHASSALHTPPACLAL